jgi:hypothetical protein
MAAPLKLHRLRLYMCPDGDTANPTELDVIVTPGDRMRGERVSTDVLPPSQRGGSLVRQHHAQTWLMVYAWCAATRAGYTGSFEAFGLELLHYAELGPDGELLADDDEPDEDDAETVPPTVPGRPTS